MQTASVQPPRDFVRILSLPAGERRNAGLNELAGRYQSHLELYIQCELKATRWSQHLEAEDLVQSLYLKLMTVEPQEQIADEKHLMNWLQCVLRNHMLERAKALKARKRDVSRVKPLPDDGPAEAAALPVAGDEDRRPGVAPRAVAPDAAAFHNEDIARFRDFLRQAERYLDRDDWELFRRHHLEGEPQSAIAAELRRTPGAVCQRLKRICAALGGRFPQFADLFTAC